MSRILAIQGSPRRRGNTELLLDALIEGACEHGAQARMVQLAEMSIRPCDGCHACWKTGRCAKNDDMAGFYASITAADVIVFGTPVYWYGPTATMKTFIDRLVYFNCPDTRPGIRGRKAAMVVPFEDTSLATAELLVSMLERSFAYLELTPGGKVLVPGVGERGDVLGKPDALQACRELGRSLCTADATEAA